MYIVARGKSLQERFGLIKYTQNRDPDKEKVTDSIVQLFATSHNVNGIWQVRTFWKAKMQILKSLLVVMCRKPDPYDERGR